MNLQKLTVHCYAEDLEDERRVTLAPGNITAIAAEIFDVTIRDLQVRPVSVLFLDGGSIDLILNSSDLIQLEEAIGSYCFE